MIEEIWKDIKEYEGLYQVSNLGRVKSLERKYFSGKNHNICKIAESKLLKLRLDKNGYLVTGLSKNGKQAYVRVHRLVAEAFIPNPNNYPQVNHKDENKENNNVDNLEWCTAKYNNNYGTRKEKASKSSKGKYNKGLEKSINIIRKKVLCITTGKEFNSIIEASNFYNIDNSSISSVCKGKRKSCGKLSDGTPLVWKYIDNSEVND